MLEAIVDRREGELVVLRTVDGQELMWPAAELPEDVVEGSTVVLTLGVPEESGTDRRALARDIINGIFGTNEVPKA